MRRLDVRRALFMIAAPLSALALALLIGYLVLTISGQDAGAAFSAMLDYAFGPNTRGDVWTNILNKAGPYYPRRHSGGDRLPE
jgi:ABC-type uncharacterized transport system permease subunit